MSSELADCELAHHVLEETAHNMDSRGAEVECQGIRVSLLVAPATLR